ncbi:MAG: replicative DNA helicase [Nitriliruptoraceae bacterium]
MSDERVASPVPVPAGVGVPTRIERIPPHSLEAEVSVLGAALLSTNATSDVVQILHPEYFYRNAHRLVFEAIQALSTAGDAVDTVTVTEWLGRHDRLDEVGGPAAIHDLTAAVPTAANAAHYARIVRQKALLRRLIEAGTEVVRLGFEDTDDADTIVDRAESIIYDVAQSGADSEYARLGDLLTTSFEQIERLAEHGSEVTGLATGFNDLDRLTAGLQPQNLIIIAARPAMGKCLVGDTRIVDAATGAPWTIRELVEQRPDDVTVHALDDHGELVAVRPDDFVANGTRPTWRIRTASGRTAQMTANHPLYTPGGWRELADLSAGDVVAVPQRICIDAPDSPAGEVRRLRRLGRLLGAADRRACDPGIAFAGRRGHPGAGAVGSGTTTQLLLPRVDAHVLQTHRGPRSASIDDAERFGGPAHERGIPHEVFTAGANGRTAFLAAVLAANAAVDVARGGLRLTYVTRSARLAHDLQHLLLRHGRTSVVASGDGPVSLECAVDGELGNDGDLEATLAAWMDAVPVGDDILFEELAAIEPGGSEPVFDLTIEPWHSFVADDLVVHNSSLALGISHYVAARLGRPAIMFSLEMSKIEIVNRLLSSEARIDSSRLRTGRLEESDWRKLGDALGTLAEAPLFIDDTPSISLNEIRAKCRRLQQKHGLDLVIVDYLQLMQSPRRIESRQQEVAEISRGLKMLAKELDVPVIALSQLSRQPEARTDKRPQLADLRESGSIEQDADIVGFIYRDEIYDEDSPDRGIAELIIAKHRNGPTSVVKLAFLNHLTTFANLARGPAPGAPAAVSNGQPPPTPV